MAAGDDAVRRQGREGVDGCVFGVACCEEGEGWVWYGGPGAVVDFWFEGWEGDEAHFGGG